MESLSAFQRWRQLTRQTTPRSSKTAEAWRPALMTYAEEGIALARMAPLLWAHGSAWNWHRGSVRDTRVAFPVLALTHAQLAQEEPSAYEHALAQLRALSPRLQVRAVQYAKLVGVSVRHRHALRYVLRRHIQHGEEDAVAWTRLALQHRAALKWLYTHCHIPPSTLAQAVLFEKAYDVTSPFQALRLLREMDLESAAQIMREHRFPWTALAPALPKGALDNADVLLAIIESMTPHELQANAAMLTKHGANTIPACRDALREGLAGHARHENETVLRATKAAEVLAASGEEAMAALLRGTQEQRFAAQHGIDGNWLVLVDRSGSMEPAIVQGRELAAYLARTVKGRVWLVFANTKALGVEVTGQPYESITQVTRAIIAGGGTSIGIGLAWAQEQVTDELHGIAILSDGHENAAPSFAACYRQFVERQGFDPTLYFYHFGKGPTVLTRSLQQADIPFETFDCSQDTGTHNLPTYAALMRANRFSLEAEVMQTPLWTLPTYIPLKEVPHAAV